MYNCLLINPITLPLVNSLHISYHKFQKTLIILMIFVITLVLAQPVFADTREDLERELATLENQIAAYENELKQTGAQKKSLQQKISQLKTEQAQLKLQIKSTALTITTLNKKITVTETKIKVARERQKNLKKSIAAILRDINVRDEKRLIETLASEDGLGAFFIETENYERLTAQLGGLVALSKTNQKILEEQQKNFSEEEREAENLLTIKTLQQTTLTGKLSEQAAVLADTKGKEEAYQTALADSKKRAAQIKNRIYELFEANKTITFGQAVEIAQWVEGQTGVRAPFLLAILTQESSLGKNVGTCNRAGDPPEKSWKVVMKPERDQEPFKTITEELGLDIDTTPVSCPMKNKDGSQLGWGGAMGPAQFIPSTWMGYRKKVTAITGKSTANPWDIRDAFVAAAVKLKADGADGTEDGEWKAAMRYFSGSTNTKYRFYGDNVLKLTDKYEQDIKDLSL